MQILSQRMPFPSKVASHRTPHSPKPPKALKPANPDKGSPDRDNRDKASQDKDNPGKANPDKANPDRDNLP